MSNHSLFRVPTSFSQELFFLIQGLQPETVAYNIPSVFRIFGSLNIQILERSLNELRRRHEIFRTTIELHERQSYQIIGPHENTPLRLIDLSHLSAQRKKEECDQCVREEIAHLFDLTVGPLFNTLLLKLSPKEHVFVITAHHTVIDLKTKDLLGAELSELYGIFTSKSERTNDQRQIPPQYAEYAHWQREWIKGGACAATMEYWLNILTKRPPLLDLPTDYPRPSVISHEGAHIEVCLDEQLTDRLRKFSKAEKVDVFLTLLTAYAVLLKTYASQTAITIGVPFTNRRREDHKNVRGCLMNIIPICVDFEPGDTFRIALRKVRMAMLDAHRHQEAPYVQLVKELLPAREPSQNPIFQVGFTFEHPMQMRLPGLDVEPIFYHPGGAQLDLFAKFWEKNAHIQGYFEYRMDLFNAATINRFAKNFKALLESVIDTPEYSIDTVPVMPKEHMEKIVSRWNRTERDYGQSTCLHYCFEEQVEKSPGQRAVSFEGMSLTYHELNCRANRLAHYLQNAGVGPDVPVGVYMNRSLEMVVALYGILKAGGAYVPLDPEYPENFISNMLQDCRPPIVLTQSKLCNQLPEFDAKVVCVDSDWHMIAQHLETNPVHVANPHNLAYVIYTSGSTGNPKGVMIEHAGICNRLFWMQDAFDLDATDRILQKTPFSFDVSVWEFFWPLMFGAELIMASPGAHRDPRLLSAAIIEYGITTIHFVPSMLEAYLASTGFGEYTTLRRVICSGEALSYELAERFYQNCNADLHNLYGPTEASVDVTHWPVPRQNPLQLVPIGKPIANTTAYILDNALQPVPIGVPGQLYIGGIQIARGYLNRPELTAKSFTSNPFSHQKNDRLYKTGDLVKYLPNGDITFLGRADFQVKIRGNRVELGAIEETLRQSGLVRDSVVIAEKGPAGGMRLVAYVVSRKPDKYPSEEKLRSYLTHNLPSYMVPSLFTTIPEIPHTTSGKVDRRKLPPPIECVITEGSAFEPSTKNLEKIIAETWCDILHCDRVSVTESFFNIGGDSLLSIAVTSRLEKVLGLGIGVVRMFQYPTVRLLAEFLTQKSSPKTLRESAKGRALRRRVILKRRQDFVRKKNGNPELR